MSKAKTIAVFGVSSAAMLAYFYAGVTDRFPLADAPHENWLLAMVLIIACTAFVISAFALHFKYFSQRSPISKYDWRQDA